MNCDRLKIRLNDWKELKKKTENNKKKKVIFSHKLQFSL